MKEVKVETCSTHGHHHSGVVKTQWPEETAALARQLPEGNISTSQPEA